MVVPHELDGCTTGFIYIDHFYKNKMNILLILSMLLVGSVLMIGNSNMLTFAQTNSTSSDDSNGNNTQESNTTSSEAALTTSNSVSDTVPTAQSVYDTGKMSLPSSVKGVIVFIPDEAHHPPTDQKTISPKNPNYVPATLEVPEGTEVAFVHDDPNHVHQSIVKDKSGKEAWTSTSFEFPAGSDSKSLSVSGSPYSVSDKDYSPPMEGKIIVTPQKSTGTLTVGAFFCPTDQVSDCKSDFTKAGFKVLSEHNFVTKTVQKDIAGDNTLLIYSTTAPLNTAIKSLGPIIETLPYK